MTTFTYEGWAILELMGHRQRVGRVSEVEAFGGELLRIDIPTEAGDVTEFYGASSVYSLRPVTEEIARDYAKRYGDVRPVRPVEYRVEDQRNRDSHDPDFDEIDEAGPGLMRRSRLIETKLRESREFFNDRPNVCLRGDRRRTSYRLAAEIEAALAVPTLWQRMQRPLIGSVIGTGLLILLLDVLPGGGTP